MFYSFVRIFLRIFLSLFFRVKISGIEHIPLNKNIILCPNHTSNWDPVVLGIVLPMHITFFAKKELFKRPILGFILKRLSVQPVDRQKGDSDAVKGAITALRSEKPILIFPEGHRIRNGLVASPKSGAVKLSYMTKSPIVPIAISSSYRLWSNIYVRILPPLNYPHAEDGHRPTNDDFSILTTELMSKIYSERDAVC